MSVDKIVEVCTSIHKELNKHWTVKEGDLFALEPSLQARDKKKVRYIGRGFEAEGCHEAYVWLPLQFDLSKGCIQIEAAICEVGKFASPSILCLEFGMWANSLVELEGIGETDVQNNRPYYLCLFLKHLLTTGEE